MSPAMEDSFDCDTQSSDWANGRDSPVVRHYSEPVHNHTNSIEASLSPAPSVHQTKCPWCGKYVETSEDDLSSQHDALKEHMATVHPRIARLSMYDGAGDEVEDKAVSEDKADDANEGEDEVDEAEVDTAAATTEVDGEDEGGNTNGDDAVETPLDDEAEEVSLEQKLRELSRQKAHTAVEKRLEAFWNIHEARNFTEDYDDEIANLEQIWDYTYREAKYSKKSDPSDIPDRPNPYQEGSVAKGEFLKITPVEEYLELLRNPEAMSYEELYAATANAAHALKTWQDEWRAIDRLSKLANRRMMKNTPNPRKTERPEVFEDKKEAMLYGYKHDPRESMIGIQDPFVQGGFRPTPAQLRKMRANVAPDDLNPDGWKPVVKFGVEFVPRFQNPPLAPFEAKNTRRRKAAQMEAAALLKEANERNTPAVETEEEEEEEEDDDGESPPSKRVARSRGGKPASTRETPQVHTAPPSPAPATRRGATTGRGARGGRGGRGRGASNNPPARSSARVATTRAAAVATSSAATAPSPSSAPAPAPAQGAPAPSTSAGAPAPTSGPTPIAPAPTTAPTIAPATSAASSASTSASASVPALFQPGETVDPAELARRQKIANSKNPRRTEAMLNHWARFNREGRVRNPKRTKAQIEADRAAEAARKANEPPKEPGSRKRKAAGPPATKTPTKKEKVEHSTGGPAAIQPAPIQPATGPMAPPPPPPPPAPAAAPTSNPAHGTAYPPAPPTLAPAGVPPYGPINPPHMAPHYPNPAPPLMPNQQPPPLAPHPQMGYPPHGGYHYVPYGGPSMPPYRGDRR
ncbi:hypothetical protein VTN96DRAFT_7611 [Rasamsonia emersonii]|uniref:Uncharacterized protein n=1 Tax=Rasamsonia emersonii (strain ATCC 16479 / CBS 393.64 / IMI 116815) TaxID=1408163 RepID=A0A0F4YPV0_RASE3|nr:Uncharacterized protein T310_6362 [Rasamsonia emersonii CBS 393.64]KKA19643.1 Uncharacterized protein T310_6362 [Rasamsonia emersonii CBS 393.64]